MPSNASAGSGCILRISNGDSLTAAVRASRTMGSGASGVVVSWGTPGTAGNGKTASIVVAGVSTPLSVVVSTTDVTINSATNGSSAATSTALDVLNALYANATFRANWLARPVAGVTAPTGVVAAATSAALANGAAGETFTVIPEVKGVRGPNMQANVIDVTSFDSARVREFINGLIDPGQLTFMSNYVPNAWGAGQQTIFPLLVAGTIRTFELVMADYYLTTISMKGLYTGAEIAAELEQALSLNVTAKITGNPTWY